MISSRDPLFFRVDGFSHSCCFLDPDEDPLPPSNPGNLPRNVFVPDAVDEELGGDLPVIPISFFSSFKDSFLFALAVSLRSPRAEREGGGSPKAACNSQKDQRTSTARKAQ